LIAHAPISRAFQPQEPAARARRGHLASPVPDTDLAEHHPERKIPASISERSGVKNRHVPGWLGEFYRDTPAFGWCKRGLAFAEFAGHVDLERGFFVGVWRFKQRYRLFNDLQQRVTIDLLENDSIKFKQYIYIRQKNSALGARQLW
jgi:hypothetical protein